MKDERASDDPELRHLLDSIGLRGDECVDELSAEEAAHAERMLAYVASQSRTVSTVRADTNRPRSERFRWSFGLVGATAVCVLVGLLGVFQPWGGGPQVYAQTPAMLHFSEVRTGQIQRGGEPASTLLKDLAGRAAALPEPGNFPVHHVELEGWWASSSPGEAEEPPQTVLTSVRDSQFLMPNNDLRSIERRGNPLDAEGTLSSNELPDLQQALSDEVFNVGHEQGARHLETLPGTVEDLGEAIAPATDCAEARGSCLLNGVSALFETYVVPPDVASLLWQVLATEPTITSLGTTTGRLGDEVVAITAPSVNGTEQWIIFIDPTNGRYVGSELILVEPSDSVGFDPPAVLALTYVRSAQRVPLTDVPDESTATRY